MTKTALLDRLAQANAHGLMKVQIKGVLADLAAEATRSLKKGDDVTLPGLVRLRLVTKPATKERKGINPFTGQETVFKAKPKRKVVKARPVKALKDAVA